MIIIDVAYDSITKVKNDENNSKNKQYINLSLYVMSNVLLQFLIECIITNTITIKTGIVKYNKKYQFLNKANKYLENGKKSNGINKFFSKL